MPDKTIRIFDNKTRAEIDVLYHDNGDGTHSLGVSSAGTLQCGYAAVLTNGEGTDATEQNQIVQLPDVPCRAVVIALPKAARLSEAFLPDSRPSSNNSRALFFGDANSQH